MATFINIASDIDYFLKDHVRSGPAYNSESKQQRCKVANICSLQYCAFEEWKFL